MLLDSLDLEQGEDILIIVRKHWLILASELAGVVIGALLPIIILNIFFGVSGKYGVLSVDTSAYTPEITFFTTTWLLFSVFSGFVVWTHYFLDLWVVTDRRIISTEQVHFFNRNVAVFRLERLQDIEFTIKGFIPTFFNFGTISAQTAGHMEANFTSKGMPNPDKLQSIIQKAMDIRLSELRKNNNVSASEMAGE
jgi:hypothetical protein